MATNKVRFGVIGLGNMGSSHARWCAKDGGGEFCLGAVCDIVPEKAAAFGQELSVPHFTDDAAMIESGLVDAVIIATPHYWHPVQAIRAARRGLHVLCEKPLASSVGPARAMVEECRRNRVALGVVLHHRTRTVMRKMKDLVDRGAIGEVFRVQMICSNWFRTQAYYDSGAWRGTWDGEGGGVLINQAPHSLDLFQWIGGMPRRVLGLIHTRAHRIEVEDTANFLCEYDGAKVGYFYATTAEEPGMEQFMLCGDKGTLIFEAGSLRLGKLKVSVADRILKTKAAWPKPNQVAWKDVPLPKDPGGRHLIIIRAFVRHVLRGDSPVCTGQEGINELELSNAMYIAGYRRKTVEMPVDAQEIEQLLEELETKRSVGRGGGLRKAAQAELKALLG